MIKKNSGPAIYSKNDGVKALCDGQLEERWLLQEPRPFIHGAYILQLTSTAACKSVSLGVSYTATKASKGQLLPTA